MTVGDWFNAQQAFNHDNFACSAGQTISEYCSKAQDTCCAVCPNAPITGPGTLIVMTLGTFVNLLFVLWYQSEAPYNLAYQIVATDAAAFGLLNRLIQSEYRLSRFHYAMVPLAMMSCLPLALASCLNDLPSYHSQPPSATAEHQLKLHDKRQAKEVYLQEVREARARHRHAPSTPSLPPTHVPTHPRSQDPNAPITGGHYEPTRPPHPRRTEHSLRRPGTNHTVRTMTHEEEEARAKRDGEGAQFKATGLRPMASARPIAMLENMGEIELPRRYLIITAWIFFTIHLFLWPFLFSYVYFFNTSFNQPNCTEEFPGIERLELVLCCLVSSWLFFAFMMWGTFTWTLYYPGKVKFDMLEWIGKALHIPREDRTKDSNFMIVVKAGFNSSSLVRYGVFTREITYVAPPQQARDQEQKGEDSNSSNRKRKERHPFWYSRARPRSLMRWLISLASFWFFCIEYMVIWFVAVDDFVLIGTNGFDFGQVVAVVSIIVPAFLIGRAQLDYEFYWDSKHKFWDKHFGQAGQTHDEGGGGGIGCPDGEGGIGGEKGLTTPDLPDGYKGFASGTKPIPRLPVIPRVASVVRPEEGSGDENSDRSSRRRGRRSSTVRRGDDYGDESEPGELEPIMNRKRPVPRGAMTLHRHKSIRSARKG